MHDFYNNISVTQLLSPINSTTTKVSTGIDLQGFDSLVILFPLGLSGDTLSSSTYWTLKIQESSDNITFTDVAVGDTEGAASSVVVNAPTLDRLTYKFGYKGGQRYVRGTAVPTGALVVNGMPIGVVAVRSRAAIRPTS